MKHRFLSVLFQLLCGHHKDEVEIGAEFSIPSVMSMRHMRLAGNERQMRWSARLQRLRVPCAANDITASQAAITDGNFGKTRVLISVSLAFDRSSVFTETQTCSHIFIRHATSRSLSAGNDTVSKLTTNLVHATLQATRD